MMSWWFGGTLSEQGELLWSLSPTWVVPAVLLFVVALVWSLRREGPLRRGGRVLDIGAADRAHRRR